MSAELCSYLLVTTNMDNGDYIDLRETKIVKP
jgi:hypothetical protein